MAQLMAAYLEEGLLDPHIQGVVSLYRDKRDAAVTALKKYCGDSVRFRTPEGGIYLWLKLYDSIDGAAVKEAARLRGVACRPGERFFGDRASGAQHLRLSFIMVPLEIIPAGVAVLGDAIASPK
jgi:2-aminoadipate transaminase